MRLLRSLYHRNFRIYFIGQLISLNGTWMQSVAQAWLIYRLTGSGLLLGLTGAATLIPSLLFGVYGGWLADRMSRRKLLIIIQAVAMAQAFTMAALTLLGWVQPWHILALAFALGLVQAVETPVRHSFVAQLVPRKDLPNAIGLNSSMFHMARFAGPAVAGLLVAWVGEGPVFLINGFTFVAVLLSLRAVRLPAVPVESGSRAGVSGVWHGLHYAWHHPPIRSALTMVAVVSLFGAATVVLMPIFAAEVFRSGAQSLGMLMGALGAGSLLGALNLAMRREHQRLEPRIAIAGIAVGLTLLAFVAAKIFWVALCILPAVGFTATTALASGNAFIQLSVPDELRGRVMALFSVCLHGMVAVGQLLIGAVADFAGAVATVAACGGILLITTSVMARSLVRAVR